jgi:hypothetical protein
MYEQKTQFDVVFSCNRNFTEQQSSSPSFKEAVGRPGLSNPSFPEKFPSPITSFAMTNIHFLLDSRIEK